MADSVGREFKSGTFTRDKAAREKATSSEATDKAALKALKGRGALSQPDNRFAATHSEFDEGADPDEAPVHRIPTVLIKEVAKTIITKNQSPDIPFQQSINPYKGCEHGCIYCFARPTHAYWDLSPGLDFETKILFKPNAAALLEKALNHPRYVCSPIALGTNTDPYQPADLRLEITRQVLLVLQAYRHPFSIITKGSHLLRDMDILQPMAEQGLCSVMISLTSLSNDLKRHLEPRAASHQTRLKTITALANAGVPVGVMIAPVIPLINDQEIETLLTSAADAGASSAAYVFLRLPYEVKALFTEWLNAHYPDRAEHVLSIIRQSRGGKLNEAEYSLRMRGEGVYADLINQRFKKAAARLGLSGRENFALDTQQFQRPSDLHSRTEEQFDLFGF